MYLKLKSVILLVISIAATHGSSQTYNYLDPNNFDGIWAQGLIPKDFTESWATKVQNSFKGSTNVNVGADPEALQKYWSSQYYFIDGMLQSGSVSFNDPISVYLNKIKDRLLIDNPKLSSEIRVYLRKSPAVNAATVADGIILFNTGLFAYAHTESELAFVMAHEIQHYSEGHLLESFQEREKLLKENIKEYRRLHPIEKYDLMLMQSKDHEFEADEAGLMLYLNSEYSKDAPGRVLSILHESYMPYGNVEVGEDFLATSTFRLPSVFYRESVSEVSKEEDYFDETHSHPNIAKRRDALDEMLKRMQGGTKDFIEPEEEFLALRELARFERVRELLLVGAYGDALYDIYVLKQKYPNSKFLDISEVKAVYALSGFKTSRNYDWVTKSTSKVEGPSQQVHHILKQFDKNQMTAYALRMVMDNMKKYPEETYLSIYADELAKYMVVYCKLDIGDFEVDNAEFLPFDKKPEDFESERQYLRAVQNHYRPVYKYLVQEEVKSGWLQKEFKAHKVIQDSIDNYMNLSRKVKNSQREDRQEQWEEGTNLKIERLVILDPTLILEISDQDSKDFIENFEKEQRFKEDVDVLAKEHGLDAIMLFSDKMKDTDVALYNKVSQLKERLSEGKLHYYADLLPPGIELSHKIEAEGNERYICSITGLLVDGIDTYNFNVYDLKKGKWVYGRNETTGFNLSSRDLMKEIETDFERIKN